MAISCVCYGKLCLIQPDCYYLLTEWIGYNEYHKRLAAFWDRGRSIGRDADFACLVPYDHGYRAIPRFWHLTDADRVGRLHRHGFWGVYFCAKRVLSWSAP